MKTSLAIILSLCAYLLSLFGAQAKAIDVPQQTLHRLNSGVLLAYEEKEFKKRVGEYNTPWLQSQPHRETIIISPALIRNQKPTGQILKP